MTQRALQDVADDLHVAVAVGAEARAGLHPVLVDHAQRAETHVLRVVIIGEGEAVVGVEPAVIGMAPVGAAAQFGHLRKFAALLRFCKGRHVSRMPLRYLNGGKPWLIN
jgi:hypothetical protein